MQILTKVVLGALGYTLIKNKDQVVKELSKSNVKKNATIANEIVEKPTKTGIKYTGFGELEEKPIITKAPERVIKPKVEETTDSLKSDLDNYVLRQVEKSKKEKENPETVDSYVNKIVAQEEQIKSLKGKLYNQSKQLYQSHVDSGVSDSIKNEIEHKIKVSSKSERDYELVHNTPVRVNPENVIPTNTVADNEKWNNIVSQYKVWLKHMYNESMTDSDFNYLKMLTKNDVSINPVDFDFCYKMARESSRRYTSMW